MEAKELILRSLEESQRYMTKALDGLTQETPLPGNQEEEVSLQVLTTLPDALALFVNLGVS